MYKIVLSMFAVVMLSACMSGGPKETGGTLLGAVGGGLIGSQFGGGNGQLVGVGLGALGGAALGNYIGKNMDQQDAGK